jgi:hypothetical protein
MRASHRAAGRVSLDDAFDFIRDDNSSKKSFSKGVVKGLPLYIMRLPDMGTEAGSSGVL